MVPHIPFEKYSYLEEKKVFWLNHFYWYRLYRIYSGEPLVMIPQLYRMSQKKRNGGFSVHCELIVWYIFTPLDKASSAEENDTSIIKFCWVILILYDHFLKSGHFQLSLDFSERWTKNCGGTNLPYTVFCGSPLIRGMKRNTEQWASTGQRMDCLQILRSSVPKIQRNLKMTVFQEVCMDSKLPNQI